MPNPIQRMLKQARDKIPGQRPVRLPWQEPTVGERVAGGVDVLADAAGELGNRAADIRLSAGDRAADLAQRAQSRLSNIQERVGGQVSDVQERVQGQVSDAGEQARGQVSQLAAARRRMRDATAASTQTALAGFEPDETAMPEDWQGAPIARVGTMPTLTASPSSAEDASFAADRAATAAARAEHASGQVLAASNQIAALLSRLLSAQAREVVRTGTTEEGPSGIEIRVGEAAESPLARAADAVARAVAAAGETLYDFSEGQYGLAPRDAREMRREREKEREHARPVAIIEGRYAEEKQARSRLPLLIAGLVVAVGLAGLAGFWFMQRRSQDLQAGTGAGRPMRTPFTGGPPAATPAFERVVRGELLPTPLGVPATGVPSAVTPAATTPTTATPPMPPSSAGGTPTFTAGESGDMQSDRQAHAQTDNPPPHA